MAATEISSQSLADTGYNLTDSADFTTLVAGAGNGVTFTHTFTGLIILKNDTGGDADFTFLLATVDDLDDLGITPADFEVTVADGKTWIIQATEVMKDATTGKVTIECDVAGKVLVIEP